ncbi:copper homeostasis membrane protein CopD [Bradyrhizobium canariense]|uniref:copper homeostasis membrane protein CopD n=1 Tax=Bradyrhizobium canariense TaxID=255045 RepID=UPI00142FF8FC|nr:copper homeostasis membrane protein CopD [Bradyrhizobium canariense]
MINPLIAVRDVHFGSTVIVAGIVFFDLFVASPTLRAMGSLLETTAVAFRVHTALALWISLALSIVSGFAWLCLLAGRIVGKPIGDVIADGTVWIVLSRTQFGFAWQLRFVFGILLAGCLLARRTKRHVTPIWQEALAALLAGAYLGSLAFAGHGEEGLGFERNLHLAADFLHLNAAGLWLGGLIPLALFLVYLRRFHEETWRTAASDAAYRFSNLGIIAVATLLVSGTINVWFLIGGMQALVGTSYGRLLLLKITLFAAMVCLAGINREYLLPRLSGDIGTNPASRVVQWLLRNSLVEIVLGIGIILIVGMLGIMAPATDMHVHLH